MRVRTAVAIVVAFVASKGALTWVALNIWATFQDRPLNPARHWHVELGNLADWVAGLGAVAAVFAALYVAGQEGRSRRRSEDSAAEAQAALVQVRIEEVMQGRLFRIIVKNYGDRAVLNVQFDWATYEKVPYAQAKPELGHGDCPVLDHDRNPYSLWVDFEVDDDSEQAEDDGNQRKRSVIEGIWNEAYSQWDGPNKPDPKQVAAGIRFRDASGVRWRRDTSGRTDRLL